jgi:hypothetical protein
MKALRSIASAIAWRIQPERPFAALVFWLGLLILMAFVHYFGWIPIYNDRPASLWDELILLSIPAAAVGFRASALIMRLTRSSMLEVLRQGLHPHRAREGRLAGRHQLRSRPATFVRSVQFSFAPSPQSTKAQRSHLLPAFMMPP